MKKNKVLFVDDEVKILNSIKRGTIEEDYEVFIATTGEKALELMNENEICVLVTDMRMPGMDGLTLLKKVKEKYPDTIRMVLSGYNHLPQILSTINQVGVSKFITKPWSVDDEFLPAIREGIEYYNLKKESEELRKALVNKNNAYQNILKISNETVINIQRDIANTRKLYDTIQNTSKSILMRMSADESINRQLSSFIDIANIIFNGYLSLQPTKMENFTLGKIYSEIVKQFGEAIEFLNSQSDITYKGNYRVIMLIFTELINGIIKNKTDKKLSVEVGEHSSEKIVFEISKFKDSDESNNRDLGKLIYLLNSISNMINGSITLEKEYIRIMFEFK